MGSTAALNPLVKQTKNSFKLTSHACVLYSTAWEKTLLSLSTRHGQRNLCVDNAVGTVVQRVLGA